jgi:hypothetical protein
MIMEKRIINITLILVATLLCLNLYKGYLLDAQTLPLEPTTPLLLVTGKAIEAMPSWAAENTGQFSVSALGKNLSLSVANADYIYKTGYIYTKYGKVSFSLEGNLVPDTNWIRTGASKTLTIDSADFEQGENYVVVYACTRVAQGFDCNSNKWILGRFNVGSENVSSGPASQAQPAAVLCDAIGSRSEGWYYSNGNLIKWDSCKGCTAACKTIGGVEGWYSSCNSMLIAKGCKGLPDLYSVVQISNVSDMSVTNPVFKQGSTIYVKATITNIGIADANRGEPGLPTPYEMTLSPGGEQKISEFMSLAPRGTVTMDAQFPVYDTLTKTLTFDADPRNLVAESNEANNRIIIPIQIAGSVPCAAEGEISTIGSLGPSGKACCQGLALFGLNPEMDGGGVLCYNALKGTPVCKAYPEVAFDQQGWHYVKDGVIGSLIYWDDLCAGSVQTTTTTSLQTTTTTVIVTTTTTVPQTTTTTTLAGETTTTTLSTTTTTFPYTIITPGKNTICEDSNVLPATCIDKGTHCQSSVNIKFDFIIFKVDSPWVNCKLKNSFVYGVAPVNGGSWTRVTVSSSDLRSGICELMCIGVTCSDSICKPYCDFVSEGIVGGKCTTKAGIYYMLTK